MSGALHFVSTDTHDTDTEFDTVESDSRPTLGYAEFVPVEEVEPPNLEALRVNAAYAAVMSALGAVVVAALIAVIALIV